MLAFTSGALRQVLHGYPLPARYWIAFSGGLDSTVLVHALADLRPDLGDIGVCAVHVDHGLSPAARAWSQHCAEVCQGLGLKCLLLRAESGKQPGESPEAAARRARYRALASVVQAHDCLLTAHQQDDQAETVLLQLLRGSGVAGLAAMPGCARFGRGWLVRPLLGFPRAALRAYAQERGLAWVEDDSNWDVGLDRNYLRHRLVPGLRERWPGYARTLARSAGHAAEALQLLDELARMDVKRVQGETPETLLVCRLRTLSPARQRNAVRGWLRSLGLPTPPAGRLQAILEDALAAAPDRSPYIAWPGAEVRRHRDLLYAMPPLSAADPKRVWPWDLTTPLRLPGGSLEAVPAVGEGLRAAACQGLPVTVRFRQGGERCRPAGSPHSRPLKYLFQASPIPPWLRDRTPLIYLGDALAAVSDLWVCEPFAAKPGEPGWVLRWSPSRGGMLPES